MNKPDKLRIGDLLVKEGVITEEQLQHALAIQKKQEAYSPLGEVCIKQKLLTRNQLHKILTKYQKRISLGNLLINLGLITPQQLDEGLEEQKKTGGRLGGILVKKGFITENTLVDTLSIQMGILKVAPDFQLIDKTLLKGISEEFLMRNEIIPAFKEDDVLTLIMSNPLDRESIRDLAPFFRGIKVKPAIASSTDIRNAINQHFHKGAYGDGATVEEKKMDLIIGDKNISLEKGDSISGILDYIITNGLREGASDIHIEPKEDNIRIRYRIDGILHHKTDLPVSLAPSLASRIKILCKLDIAEKRRHQDGRIHAQIMDKEVDLRVSVYASAFGENIVIRVLYRQSALIDIDKLGITPQNKIKLMKILDQPSGVILVTGPTGSGKTTTLYAGINYLNDGKTSIITVEDPVEYVIDGVVQGQLSTKLGHTYNDFIKSMMRQDPDVIMVGEIRDAVAAEAVIQAALTGHKVLTTFHTEDTTGALLRLMDMGIDTFLISSTVIFVLAQRLVRVLCTECKQAYVPSKYELDALGVRAENMEKYTFYKPVGCAHCKNMGYLGRTGIHELLMVNDMVRDAILARKTSGEIRRLAREGASLVTMREDGFYKVLKGITSFEEISRCIPWQEIDDVFRRSPEEIIALAEGGTAVAEVETAVIQREENASESQSIVEVSDASPIEEKIYRIRFDTRTIDQEREKITNFFAAYRRMMEKIGQPLEPSRLMEDFIEFIIFTVKRVERSLKTPFIEFSLHVKDGQIEMQLETMVPKQLPFHTPRKPDRRGPRLISFLLPPDAYPEPGEDESLDRTGQDIQDPKSWLHVATAKPETAPMSPGFTETQSLPGRKALFGEQTGLYRKHVEKLEWKVS